MKNLFLIFLVFVVSFFSAFAQVNYSNTFYSSFFEAAIPENVILETGVVSQTISNNGLYLSSSIYLSSKISLASEFILGSGFDRNDEQLIVALNYNLLNENTKLSIGPAIEFRENNIGLFSALSQKLSEDFNFTSKAGFFFDELGLDPEMATIGASIIYNASENISLSSELNFVQNGLSRFVTDHNLLLAGFGIDYRIVSNLGLRGYAAYNFLDSRMDLVFQSGLSYSF